MNTALPRVSVVIPTLASASRATELRRAIASVRASTVEPVRIVVVVNGQRFDPAVSDWLRDEAGVDFRQTERGSLPLAILHGRREVRTRFFATLDDDDEYLPGALDRRLAAIEAQPEAALVVSNGFIHRARHDHLAIPHLSDVPADPLRAMFRSAWLNSGNALYRSEIFTPEFFEDYHSGVEWTWLAFRIATLGKTIAVDPAPGFRVHDSPQSLSKSDAYVHAYQGLYARMLEAALPPDVSREIRRRLGSALHDASVSALAAGQRRDALRLHLRSLAMPGGLRFAAYTRRLWRTRPQQT